MPGKKLLIWALIATGHTSLVGRYAESKTPSKNEEEIGLTEEEIRALIESDETTGRIEIAESTPDTLVINVFAEDGSVPSGENVREVHLPGKTEVVDTRVQMEWAGRKYEVGAREVRSEADQMRKTVADSLNESLARTERLGIAPQDIIKEVHIATTGSASSEGPMDKNNITSDNRADLLAQIAQEPFLQHGLTTDQVTVDSSTGIGEQGNLQQFLEDAGISTSGMSATQIEQTTHATIKSIHDGRVASSSENERLLQSFKKHVAKERYATAHIQINHKDVVVRYPISMNEQADALLRYYKEYGRADGRSDQKIIDSLPGESGLPPLPPGTDGGIIVDPGNPPYYEAIRPPSDTTAPAAPKNRRKVGAQTAPGIGSNLGMGIGRGPQRSGKRAGRHHTGK